MKNYNSNIFTLESKKLIKKIHCRQKCFVCRKQVTSKIFKVFLNVKRSKDKRLFLVCEPSNRMPITIPMKKSKVKKHRNKTRSKEEYLMFNNLNLYFRKKIEFVDFGNSNSSQLLANSV